MMAAVVLPPGRSEAMLAPELTEVYLDRPV